MDLIQLSMAAAALLAPHMPQIGAAIAEGVSGLAPVAIQDLYRAVCGRLSVDQDSSARKALDEMTRQPNDAQHQATLAALLARHAQADPDFARELARLVETATQDASAVSVVNMVSGEARVGKIVTVRDVSGDLKF
jgi:hypothetical protein